MSTIIDKPWGREIILAPDDAPYTAKIEEIKAGQRNSLQYHDQKVETLTLISGQAEIIWGSDQQTLTTENMDLFKPYHIKPGIIHRFKGITDCKIFETSSKETGTTVRLEDDYSRPDETQDIRNSPNRGWNPPQNENS
jgi:mannose-6-phosphate isomerase